MPLSPANRCRAIVATTALAVAGCGSGITTTQPKPTSPTSSTTTSTSIASTIVSPPTPSSTVPTTTSSSGTPDQQTASCTTKQLALGLDAGVSEHTGQHTIDLTVRNNSTTTCLADGYPGIGLLGANGSLLSFDYRRGGDQEVTTKGPPRFQLVPGQVAYVRINKYRCDGPAQATGTSVQFIAPNDTATKQISLPTYPTMEFCGSSGPGSMLDISPLEPTEAATASP